MDLALHETAEGIINHPMPFNSGVSLKNIGNNGHFEVPFAIRSALVARM